MREERERKFKVTYCDESRLRNGDNIVQGYLSFEPQVRVRLRAGSATLTVKDAGVVSRQEFEYSIPVEDAAELLKLAKAVITKQRYLEGDLEIDIFSGALAGLVIAELECEDIHAPVQPPDWLKWEEVTGDPRYLNVNMAQYGCREL